MQLLVKGLIFSEALIEESNPDLKSGDSTNREEAFA